jgi:oxygen-independent coproporphyrinogen-3 oxidase
VTVPAEAPPVALYVHIPFCVSLCPYCDFVVYAGAAARGPRARVAAFEAALLTELRLRAAALDDRWGPSGSRGRAPLASVYLGGGTPTLLPAGSIGRLLAVIRERFGVARDAEVTIEANPGPDERGDARALARLGITRMSIGAQALDDRLLRTLGRRHRAADVATTLADARTARIPSISVDLLYDVPGQSIVDWADTLDGALALGPDHLSLYALTLDDPDAEGLTGPLGDHLPTRTGARRWREHAGPRQDEDRAAAQYHHATHVLAEHGFRGYEISNWATPGHESRHNLAYWRRLPHEAVGPGAHAFDGVTRRWNAARLDRYLAALTPSDGAAPRLPPGGAEPLDPLTATAESIILGLRLEDGIALARAFEPPLLDVFGWALAAELLEVVETADGDRVRLTTRGRLLSNELFGRLV